MKSLRPYLVITAALLFACCVVYPALVTLASDLLFTDRSTGSLVYRNGRVAGSSLIGQSVADWKAHPEYLWGRPSAASPDAATKITYSSGSNLGPTNPALLDEVKARVAILRESGIQGPIPVDLVTKSASGLDPHLSLRAAELQIPRIAAERKLAGPRVRELIESRAEQSTFGFLGEPRVNVLLVNLDLDQQAPYAGSPKAVAGGPPAP